MADKDYDSDDSEEVKEEVKEEEAAPEAPPEDSSLTNPDVVTLPRGCQNCASCTHRSDC